MKNSELIQDHIDRSKPLTQDVIDSLSVKEFHSGRPILPGDRLLVGMLSEHVTDSHGEVKLIRFHPEEYGTLYEAAFPDHEIGSSILGLKYKK